MRLLLANDDGVYSPGLLALASVAAEFGEVRIYAPDVEQSSMGHAITHSRPLVNGTPADCVAIGSELWDDVDVVLSGINMGPNLGNGMWHSGTLAAAKQGALLGKRGIALSTPTGGGEPEFEKLLPWVSRVLETLLPRSELNLVNVNLPQEPVGMCWTRQAVTQYDGRVVPSKDPMGRAHYWLSVRRLDDIEEGTDRWAMRNSLVSLTPLRLDLTDEVALERAARQIPLSEEISSGA
jgi:5'-nucleotidase